MTYLKKILSDGDYITYAYGDTKECAIGNIKFNKNNVKDVTFKYFADNGFTWFTAQAYMAICSFAREGSYPDTYLRATH